MSHNRNEGNFKVVLTGSLLPGISLEEAEKRLSQLFNTTPDKIKPLLQGRSVTIKKGLDAERASQYRQMLSKVGVEFEIVEDVPELSQIPKNEDSAIAGARRDEHSNSAQYEVVRGFVSSKSEAERELRRWKILLPESRSAYLSDNKMPLGSLVYMLGGVVLAIPCSLLISILFSLMGYLISLVFFWLLGVIDSVHYFYGRGIIRIAVFIIFLAISAVIPIILFMVAGATASETPTIFSKLKGNRNVVIAYSGAVVSTLISFLILNILISKFDWTFLETKEGWDLAKMVSYYINNDWLGIGLKISALILMVTFGISRVPRILDRDKFCSSCNQWLDEWGLGSVVAGAGQELSRNINSQDIKSVCNLLAMPTAKGKTQNCQPRLYQCPVCRNGYIEAVAEFNFTWTNPSEGRLKKSWLIASQPVRGGDLELLKKTAQTQKGPLMERMLMRTFAMEILESNSEGNI